MKKAVILLSGGLDSATCLAIAKAEGFECYTMSFDYGQRHKVELNASRKLAEYLGAFEHKIVKFDNPGAAGSALTNPDLAIPSEQVEGEIPLSYVPARNTIFLSMALGWAEVLGARDIFIGVSDIDYSGYPDCRQEFIHAFEKTANLATRAGVEGDHFHIRTPLLGLSKAGTIKKGLELGVDYAMTVTCYAPDDDGRACGECLSCDLRRKGFEDAGVADVTCYRS